MGKTLKYEIKQSQPFAGPEEEAILNLERTADHFQHEVHMVLRHYGLTSTQYNALRILRAKGLGGMTCSDLGSRLISSDPDVTRLLDRLAKQKLVRRRREIRDRRVVLTEISEEGLLLLEVITPVLDNHIRGTLQHMPQHRVRLLIELLEEARHSEQAAASGASGTLPLTAVTSPPTSRVG